MNQNVTDSGRQPTAGRREETAGEGGASSDRGLAEGAALSAASSLEADEEAASTQSF